MTMFTSSPARKAAQKVAPSKTTSSRHADHVLATFKTQHDAIEWAKKNGHRPHVARVRHLNDKSKPDHWRAV